jgi:3-oxoacyl-[acyl-carrier-protein] synthase III
MTAVPVGIAGLGVYVPEGVMTAAELAERAGIPEAVIREKFGLREKRIAGPDEHVSDLAAAAARAALASASATLGRSVDAAELDALIYFGSPHKEHPVWLAAPRIQHLLGAYRAWTFELGAVSAGAPVALRVAADLMAADPRLCTVLLVASSRESSLLDYGNERARFLLNFGDGAAAAVLVRGLRRNVILGSAFLTDGSFCEDVRVPAGGSRRPASAETVREGLHTLDVRDPVEMKQRLDPVSLDRFEAVAREAVRESRYRMEDVGFLAMLHTKRSLREALLDRLGVAPERTPSLDHYGHVSAADPFIALWEGERAGRIPEGTIALTLAAGTGYTWAATAVAWGEEVA